MKKALVATFITILCLSAYAVTNLHIIASTEKINELRNERIEEISFIHDLTTSEAELIALLREMNKNPVDKTKDDSIELTQKYLNEVKLILNENFVVE